MRSHNQTELSEKLQNVINQLVDSKTGVITRLHEVPLQASEHELHIYTAGCSDINYVLQLQHGVRPKMEAIASGAGLSKEEALWSTVDEACERYIATYHFANESFVASENSFSNLPIKLADYIAFSKEQYQQTSFPFLPVDSEAEIHWAQGVCLNSLQQVPIPAQLVWLNQHFLTGQERFFPQISTGLAAGESIAHAALTGLREVIERDAFTSYWLLQKTPRRIRPELLVPAGSALEAMIERSGLTLDLLWLETDIQVPSILCLLQLPECRGLAVGMSTHLNAAVAAEKAIVEAFHTYNWILEMRRSGLTSLPREQLRDFEHHVRFYLQPENHQYVAFLQQGADLDAAELARHQFKVTDHDSHLAELTKRITNAGFRSCYVDISKPEFTELSIYAVKAVIPGLQPLHVGVGTEFLDDRRLRQLCDYWQTSMPASLNLEPHPFP
ncbi:MAG: YcaO-like family protein [Gammaproteobacteria bacterium]|nr:YcaO-like family protein [Gammaproteobacteria bacterium]